MTDEPPAKPKFVRPKGNGMGWGGPPKGAGKPAEPFTADSPTRVTRKGGQWDRTKRAARLDKAAKDAKTAERMRKILLRIATKGESEVNQIRAAEAMLNRIEGMPIARTVTATINDIRDLSDAALAAELERLGGTPPALIEGAPEEAGTPKPNGVVH